MTSNVTCLGVLLDTPLRSFLMSNADQYFPFSVTLDKTVIGWQHQRTRIFGCKRQRTRVDFYLYIFKCSPSKFDAVILNLCLQFSLDRLLHFFDFFYSFDSFTL